MNNLTRIIRYNIPIPKLIPKISAIMLNTIICVWLIFSFPLSVYASEHGGGGSTSDSITTWTDEQKADYFKTNFTRLLARVVGVVRGSDSADSVFNSFKNIYYTDTIQQNMTWEQWLAQDLGWTFDDKGEPTITLSVDCQNAMQQAVDKWIDTQGYIYAYTFDIKDAYSDFVSKDYYDKAVQLCKSNQYISALVSRGYSGNGFYRPLNDCYFIRYSSNDLSNYYCVQPYDSNWTCIASTSYLVFSDDSKTSSNNSSFYLSKNESVGFSNSYIMLFSYGRQRVKIFNSLNSFKADSVGSQTYYITNDYSKGATYNTTKTIDNSE